jgi:hypothetical protein
LDIQNCCGYVVVAAKVDRCCTKLTTEGHPSVSFHIPRRQLVVAVVAEASGPLISIVTTVVEVYPTI